MSTQVPPSRLDSTKDFSSLVPSAFAKANAAFAAANNSTDTWVRTQANNAFVTANASYTAQNTTAGFANGAFVTANASYTAQNTTAGFANGAFVTANASYTAQNTTAGFANGSFDKANSAGSFANGAFSFANAAFAAANSASGAAATSTPRISSIVYPGDDTAAATAGGQTVTLNGAGFNAGASVLINGSYAGVVSVANSTSLSFTTPSNSGGTYILYVINTDGGTGISVPGISYSGTPSWSNTAGSLATVYETAAVNTQLTATGGVSDGAITYSVYSGTLPPGSSLNTSTGLLSGTSQGVASSTTYNFTIRATDAQNQDTDRAFSITISPDVVTWSSPSDNSTTTAYEYAPISNVTMSATSAAGKSITYTANTLPTGLTISGNTISGTPTVVANTNTRLTANAATTFKTATKDINFVVNPDVVTWSSPADGTSTELSQDQAMSNVTLSATSAAGKSITYTANTLPTGVTITGAVVNGTPTVTGTTNSLITATAATTNRTATRNFTWVVSVANDTYFKNVSLLLNGETTVTPFISDASTNSLGLTINGDTKPTLFNPYQGDGYYSNYFDGTGDYLTAPASTAWNFTGDWTFECWIYPTAITGYHTFLGQWGAPDNVFIWKMNSSGRMYLENLSTALTATSTTIVANQWQHIALTRSSNTIRMFVNGVLDATTATRSGTYYSSGVMYVGASGVAEAFTGYINSMRILKGTALYTTTFTPPTAPLTAIANTSLLTCQSNRFLDKSTNAFTMTKAGDTLVSPNIPFTANSSYSTYGSGLFPTDTGADYLRLPASVSGLAFNADFTLEFWVYVTGTQVRQFFGSTTSGKCRLYVNAGYLQIYSNGSGTNISAAGAWPNDSSLLNQWVHIAISRTGSNLYFFVNGVSKTIAVDAGAVTDTLDFNNQSYIGTYDTTKGFQGYMADFRAVKGTGVYSANFTPPTSPLTAIANTSLLTLQYNGGATNSGIIDKSNFNNIITRAGNTSQGTFSPFSQTGWSNYFNGSADYLTLPSSSTAYNFGVSVDFTIEAWVYPTVLAGYYWGIIDARVNGATPAAWILGLVPSGGTYRLEFYNAGANDGTTSIPLNTWTHVAASRVGSNLRLYVNGILDTTITGYGGSISPGTTAPRVGTTKDASGTNYATTGYISNLRIVNGTGLYSSNFTPSTTPLTPITNTSLLTNQSNRFIDNSPNSFTLTPSGTTSVQAFSPFGSISEATPLSYSNYFAGGASDYLTVTTGSSQLNLPGDFTVELWFCETNTTPTIPQFASGTTGGFACGINAYDGNATRKLDWRAFGSAPVYGVTAITSNVWHHAAYVKSGSTFRIFLDGVLEYYNGSYSTTFTSTATYIGSQNSGDASYSFRGYISNFRVVKGTAVYTTSSTTIGASIFTPSTTPLTAITNTALLTCQSTRIIDNSTNALTMTGTGTYTVKQFNPFGYTAQSATSYTPSLHGGSAYFDGTGDNLTTPNISSWQFGTGDFTVEFWVYPKGNGTIVGLTTSGAGTGYWNAILSSGNFYWASGVVFRGTSGIDYTNAWHHFAYVRSSGTSKMYIDGINQSSGADSTNYNATVGTLTIGSGDSYGTMTGYISDLRITKGTALYTSNFVPPAQILGNYSTTIPAQLLLNFNNGGIIDQHGTNVLETVGNAQLSTSVKKYNNASIYFDGTGDYLSMPSNQLMNFGTGDFTVEAWVYPNSLSTDWFIASASGSGGFFFGFSSTTTIGFGWGRAGTAWDYRVAGNATVSTWQHVAITRSGTSMRLFVNGTQSGTTQTLATAYDMSTTSTTVGSQGANYYLNGYIDDLRITKGYARYTSNFTAPTSALITK